MKLNKSQEKVVNHLDNISPTNIKFSFSKAPRFPILKRMGKSDNYYNLPSMISKRGTSFGYGNKYDFTKNKSGSEFISIKRYCDKGNQPGLKYSFGLARDKFRKVFCPGFKMIDKDIPGPGKYNLFRKPGEDSPHYSMYEKCNSKSYISRFSSPGPGEYTPLLSINPNGQYPISKISNIKSTHFGIGKSKRFIYKNNKVPGPGTYIIKGLMGVNFNSKYKSGNLISIHKKFRKKDDRDNFPGPGAYSSFSDFGLLTSRDEHDGIKICNSNKLSPIKKKE